GGGGWGGGRRGVGGGRHGPGGRGGPRGERAGGAASLGRHESQARLWENRVGRSRPSWEHCLPPARRHFPAALHGVRLDAFYLAVNHVAPSCLRIGADEATYNLHILLRLDLEQALVAGQLRPPGPTGAWAVALERSLGP